MYTCYFRGLCLLVISCTIPCSQGKCIDPLGMEDGRIHDSQITASSEYASTRYHGTNNARLNRPAATDTGGAWCAQTNDANQWIQVDFGEPILISGIILQGAHGGTSRVTQYKVQYSDNGVSWRYVKDASQQHEKFFDGNSDINTPVTEWFSSVIMATYIRIRPTAWYGHICLRFEVRGCEDDINFSSRSLTVNEGIGVVNLTLSSLSAGPVLVDIYTSGGSATENVDYKAFYRHNVSIESYGTETVRTVSIFILDDMAAETPETFNVSIAPASVGSNTTVEITILDDIDPIPTENNLLGIILLCNAENMTAIFNTSFLPYNKPSKVHLLDRPDCVASEYVNNQAMISIGYNACNTVIMETEGHIVFRNTLIVDPVDDDSPIDQPRVNIQCALQRRFMVDTRYLASHTKTHTSFGNFSFGLDIFQDNDFSHAFRPNDYPVTASVNENIHLAARVFTAIRLDLFIDSCWATPSPDPWDDINYSLILHGCADAAAVQFHESGDPTTEQFSFQAIKFKGDNWLVYIHCQLLVCDMRVTQSRCSLGCDERKKRSEAAGRMRRSDRDLHTVSVGPIIFRG